MTKVYTLEIHNYDALDGFMTSTDIKVFFDKSACSKWVKKETKHQEKLGFKPTTYDDEYVEFTKETLHGDFRHVFFGQYREVIK